MQVFRLCTREHPELDGVGAAVTGGRWNPEGIKAVYTASSSALAVLEYAVHLRRLPSNLLLLAIEVPDTLEIENATHIYTDVHASQQLGEEWVRAGKKPVLRVPSVIVPYSFNYLINPDHRLAAAIKVVCSDPYVLDHRLLSGIRFRNWPMVKIGPLPITNRR